MILTSEIPIAFACLRPCRSAKASACMLVDCPNTQANFVTIMTSLFLIIPPAPANPGLPFTAPSKNKEYLDFLRSRSDRSFSFPLNCHSFMSLCCLISLEKWRSNEAPHSKSCWLRFKSGKYSPRLPFHRLFILMMMNCEFNLSSLKTLLLRSSQICRQTNFGKESHAALKFSFFGSVSR